LGRFIRLAVSPDGTSRRGQRRSQKPFLGAAIEGSGGGDATNPSNPLDRATPNAWRVMPGVTGGRKGAGPLKLQSVSASRGTGAAWKEAHLGAHEEQSSRSHRRMTVERTSIFATTLLPSRGVAGTGGLSGALPHVRVEQGTRCGHNAREVPPLVAALARQKRCAEPVRGGDSHRRKTVEPLLGSARSRRHALSGACTCAARQPASSPRGGGTRSRRRGVRHPSSQYEETMQLVVGARASSYCRSR